MKRRRESMRLLKGDNRETLHQVKSDTVQTVVTSPPYWAVRDYDTPPVEFEAMTFAPAIGLPPYQVPAWSGQLGLEVDPWHYVGHLLQTFRQVRRVLRPDGTLWVNLGDTYYSGAGMGSHQGAPSGKSTLQGNGHVGGGPKLQKLGKGAPKSRHGTPNRTPLDGWKPKDLVGIPWMFAKAMQADGWTLRSDIVWHKPNPMPGSQKDRPTSAHEYLFLFSKGERYYYDNEAVKEPVTDATTSSEYTDGKTPSGWDTSAGDHRSLVGRHRPTVERGGFNGKTEAMPGRNAFRATRTTREKRDVWSIASRPYKGAHFATFPLDLVAPCVLAGSSAKGACPTCGAPWRRLVEQRKTPIAGEPDPVAFAAFPMAATELAKSYVVETVTAGWRPTCVCGSDPALKMRHDDLEEMETPTGEQVGECQALQKGRAAGKQPGEDSGKRLITRYEHRLYAAQIQALSQDHRRLMEAECEGKRQFEHYTRLDRYGARPIPPELLEDWIGRGCLRRVEVPQWTYPTPVPCVVLDPFAGSGTVGECALSEGRDVILCELADHYHPLIAQRTTVTPPLFAT